MVVTMTMSAIPVGAMTVRCMTACIAVGTMPVADMPAVTVAEMSAMMNVDVSLDINAAFGRCVQSTEKATEADVNEADGHADHVELV